jgi:SPP1 family predicted phage head-tail adaptor
MRTGKLRNLAKIQQNTPTRDTAGGEIAAWADFVSSWWCDLVGVKGGEMYRGRVVHAQADYQASGRYVAGVTAKMRVTLGSRTFDVMAVENVDNRGRELQLDLRERNV